MKIIVLTVYDAPNYGSFLQAYATQKFLEELGHEVYFLKYRTFIDTIKLAFVNKKSSLLHPLFTIERYYKFYKCQKKYFKTIKYKEAVNIYDKCIIGSDELWNVRNDKYFSNELFYGKGFEKDKTLILAISCNTSKKEDFKEELIKRIKELENITYRDNNTREFIDSLDVKCDFCCDPTFLNEKSIYNLENFNIKLPKNFLLFYSYGLKKSQVEEIKKYAKNNNLKIVSLCNYNSWADYNINCTPLEFIEIMKKAKCVITSTFHGSIFSVLNHKQFICLKDMPKVNDLLVRLDLKYLIMPNADESQISEIINKEIDYKNVDNKIDLFKDKSIDIIKKFLNKG